MSVLKSQIVKATSWSLLQRVGTMLISFVTNMILARLLTPDDFGCVGLILTFVSIADLFVDAGLGQSLIQKQNVEKRDISTVFTTNLLLSVAFFLGIFLIAPWVEAYMNVPNLALYLRVEASTIIIRSLYVVHNAMVNKQLNFKTLAMVSISAAFVSSSIAVVMAILDFGVWSLIGKNITMHLTFCVLFALSIRIRPSISIDKKSLKQLFSFGWFVSLSSLVDVLFTNIASFIIGKRYTVAQLGYYTQAHNLKQIPVYSLSMVISQVLFPTFSKEQDNIEKIKTQTQKVITIATALIFPLMLCLCVVAEPLISFLYSAKWIPSAPYFRILCVAGMVNILIHINRSVLMAIGRSKTIFRIQVAAICLGVVMMLVALRFDIMTFIASIALYSFVNWMLISIATGKIIGYSMFCQIKDIWLSLLLSLATTALSYFIMIKMGIDSVFLSLVINVVIFFVIYALSHIVIGSRVFRIIYSEIRR